MHSYRFLFFCWEGSPTQIDRKKSGTLILTPGGPSVHGGLFWFYLFTKPRRGTFKKRHTQLVWLSVRLPRELPDQAKTPTGKLSFSAWFKGKPTGQLPFVGSPYFRAYPNERPRPMTRKTILVGGSTNVLVL